MCCKNFWTKLIPFSMALIFGLLTVNILQKQNSSIKKLEDQKTSNQAASFSGNGIGSGFGSGRSVDDKSLKSSLPEVKPVQIISKPRALYTDVARVNDVQGTVTLRVTFLSNGEIGSVSTINNLPCGLTEQAISAARGIKFEPAEKNGIPVTVIKQVQYTFTLY